ncbi:MAG: Holliday junction branch migration DNA helicase RuvB [Alphaproteobacteria bacterium]|nr:Holliday junction branch migration DNA helicase RuvB [Alphaproteobacteria bacterium]
MDVDKNRDIESTRPLQLGDFTGQVQLKDNLKVFIESAKTRGKSIDHILFHGPPGLGKTTLAKIVANELGTGFRGTAAPMITKSGDLAAILSNLEKNDVLFIDEIHRLTPAVEEVLYAAMEDFQLDIIIGEGPSARSVKIDLAPFTLVGATTRTGLLTTPLRERFGIPLKLHFYEDSELAQIVKRGAGILGVNLDDGGALEIARRSRGTPRIANRLLKRVRDFSIVDGVGLITAEVADSALNRLDIDKQGLEISDRAYMKFIIDNFSGGPVGIETVAAGLSEAVDTLEDVIEPFLLKKGFLNRTPRGRVITQKGYEHLNIAYLNEN